MSQAETLLASLTEDVVIHEHMVTDPDGYFLIDPDSRVITTVSAVQNTLMQYDHESERYTFEVSRIIEGHDMMKCNRVRVHYNNIDSKTKREFASVDELTDLAVSLEDPSTVTCSWLIPRDATQYAGILSFLIQFMCVADDGTIVYEWHTDIYSDVEVKPGRRNGEQVVSPYNDLLEDWYQRLFGSKDSVMADIVTESTAIKETIEAKGAETLETIPDDYTELYNTSRDALRTRANAIVQSMEGETAVATDCSNDHIRGLRIFGKTTQVTTKGIQLLNIPDKASHIDRGLTQVISDGACIVSGVANSTASFNLTLAGGYSSTDAILTLEAGTYTATDCSVHTYDGMTRTQYSGTFTISTPIDITWVATRSYGATEGVNETTYPRLNKGSEALEWEPYSGGVSSPSSAYPQPLTSVDNPTVSIYGKNLLEPKSNSGAGYTSVVNPDGSVTITGAASTTNSIYFTLAKVSETEPLVLNRNKTYHMWAETNNGQYVGIKTQDSKGNPQWAGAKNWGKHNGTDCMDIVQIYIESTGHEVGDTSLCGTYRFQLEVGDTFTGYEPYKAKQTITPTTVNTLRGIPVTSGGTYTDSNGQQWVVDEIDFKRGVYIQRVGIATLNDTNVYTEYILSTKTGRGQLVVAPSPAKNQSVYGTLCNVAKRNTIALEAVDGEYYENPSNIVLVGDIDETEESIRIKYIDLELIYVIATPIETPLTEEEIFKFSQLRSNHLTTVAVASANAHTITEYNADTETYLEQLPKATDEQVDSSVEKYLIEHSAEIDARLGDINAILATLSDGGAS